MTALAQRLDPCVNWFKLVARTRGRILWIFPALLLFGYLVSLSRSSALQGYVAQASARRADAPLLAEARRLDLSYETVAANPAAYAGKPVTWCLDHPAPDLAYVSGRPSWGVTTDAAWPEYFTNAASGGYCYDVLAVVQPAARGLVQLHVVGKL